MQAITLPCFFSKIHKINYTVTLPLKTLCYSTALPYPPKSVMYLSARGHLGWLLSTLSHKHPGWTFSGSSLPWHLFFSFLPIQMLTLPRRSGWEHTFSLKHPLLTPDSKDNQFSLPPRTSTICTVRSPQNISSTYKQTRTSIYLSIVCRKAKLPISKFRAISELVSYYQHPWRTWFQKIPGYSTTLLGTALQVLLATILGMQMLEQWACALKLNFVFLMATTRHWAHFYLEWNMETWRTQDVQQWFSTLAAD